MAGEEQLARVRRLTASDAEMVLNAASALAVSNSNNRSGGMGTVVGPQGMGMVGADGQQDMAGMGMGYRNNVVFQRYRFGRFGGKKGLMRYWKEKPPTTPITGTDPTSRMDIQAVFRATAAKIARSLNIWKSKQSNHGRTPTTQESGSTIPIPPPPSEDTSLHNNHHQHQHQQSTQQQTSYPQPQQRRYGLHRQGSMVSIATTCSSTSVATLPRGKPLPLPAPVVVVPVSVNPVVPGTNLEPTNITDVETTPSSTLIDPMVNSVVAVAAEPSGQILEEHVNVGDVIVNDGDNVHSVGGVGMKRAGSVNSSGLIATAATTSGALQGGKRPGGPRDTDAIPVALPRPLQRSYLSSRDAERSRSLEVAVQKLMQEVAELKADRANRNDSASIADYESCKHEDHHCHNRQRTATIGETEAETDDGQTREEPAFQKAVDIIHQSMKSLKVSIADPSARQALKSLLQEMEELVKSPDEEPTITETSATESSSASVPAPTESVIIPQTTTTTPNIIETVCESPVSHNVEKEKTVEERVEEQLKTDSPSEVGNVVETTSSISQESPACDKVTLESPVIDTPPTVEPKPLVTGGMVGMAIVDSEEVKNAERNLADGVGGGKTGSEQISKSVVVNPIPGPVVKPRIEMLRSRFMEMERGGSGKMATVEKSKHTISTLKSLTPADVLMRPLNADDVQDSHVSKTLSSMKDGPDSGYVDARDDP
ncbi:hypothetical protein HDU76_006144 [Blyttiomyces sp. JEL0837]|nr:hypothetical protein HDU76_006144 [Blyttiomyces sp. JEL0837]